MSKKRILFIAAEMSPYLELTDFSEVVNKLAIKANNTGWEARCIMPRYGLINERRHKLHEVVRLSGINVPVGEDDYPLQIKVASLPSSRLQVYFLENEDFFKRKAIFHNEQNVFFEDNHLRSIFFCKGALETVKKFGWAPDIIHCSGWLSALAPAYIKTAYKREPVFGHSKVVFSIGEKTFVEKLNANFAKQAFLNVTIKDKEVAPYTNANNLSLFRGAANFADAVGFGSNVDKKLHEEFDKLKGKTTIPFKDSDSDLLEYLDVFESLSK